MNSKIELHYVKLLSTYIWLAIYSAIYFVLVDIGVFISQGTLFIPLYIVGIFVFFALLIDSGRNTYSRLSKFDKSNSSIPHYAKEGPPKTNSNAHAPEIVFYRIYEVIAALSIYEASRGVIFSIFAPNSESTPLGALFHNPAEFVLFIVFIIISIQFIVGVSKHFESEFTYTGSLNLYAIFNYILILGEAIALLSMGISVSLGNIALFSLWFIALLVIDYIWILLFRVLRVGVFGFRKALGAVLTEIGSSAMNDVIIHQVVNRYWISANIAFIIYLAIMETVAKAYVIPSEFFFYIYLLFLLVGSVISTYVNSKCLSLI